MAAIEDENPALRASSRGRYQSLTNDTLVSLLRSVNAILGDIEGDAFGKVYEYFLGKFAIAEGAKGGEYFTPTSIVRLIVEIIEPFNGKILDPACGSGGMFVQSARFVEEHRNGKPGRLSIYGQERVDETLQLCKMNLAVHGLEGQISQSNTYYEDPFKAVGQFDYVMANPPFNVNKIDKASSKATSDSRSAYPGRQRQLHLDSGVPLRAQRQGPRRFRDGELCRRCRRIRAGDSQEANRGEGCRCHRGRWVRTSSTPSRCRSHCGSSTEASAEPTAKTRCCSSMHARCSARSTAHIATGRRSRSSSLANIARLYRGETDRDERGSARADDPGRSPTAHTSMFPDCAPSTTLEEIEKQQGWSLNPGRYVGVAEAEDDGVDFRVRLEELSEELEKLNAEAAALQERIAANVAELLG